MDKKFIVLCKNFDGSNAEKIDDVINEISNTWIRINGGFLKTFLITTDNSKKVSTIRDAIADKTSCGVIAIEIKTTGNAAAHGEFASDKHWNWFNDYVKNEDKIDNIIPDAKLTSDKNEVGI